MEKRENFDKNVFFDNLFDRVAKEEEKMRKMIESDEYIKWLEVIIDRFSFFFDSENLDVDKYSLHDIENMNLLGQFYNFIDKYAKKNFIFPKKDSLGISYVVKYGNNHYHVGIRNDYTSRCYCIRNIESEAMVIEYEDFKNDIPCEKVKIYNEKLKELEEYITNMNETIPLEVIEYTCNDTIQKIKSKNK